MTDHCHCPCGCKDDDFHPTDDRTALPKVMERRDKRPAGWSEDPQKICDACYWDLVDAANGSFMNDVGVALHAPLIERMPR